MSGSYKSFSTPQSTQEAARSQFPGAAPSVEDPGGSCLITAGGGERQRRRTAQMAECRWMHYLLLAWLLLLSAGQVAFLTVYLAKDSKGGGEVTSQTERGKGNLQTTLKPPTEPSSDSAKIIALEASAVDSQGRIHWKSLAKQSLVTSDKGVLTLMQDGYYFLCLTVTLSKKGRASAMVTVTLKDEVILQGMVNNDTLSTGTLARVKAMSTWNKLVVSVEPRADVDVDNSPAKTNLGIIRLPKP